MGQVTSINKCFTRLPRNPISFYGGITLFSVENETFFRFDFGNGDNLTNEDVANGYDDYINYEAYKWDGKTNLLNIIEDIKQDEFLDSIDGLIEVDGGMMLVRRSDYSGSGDIRMYLENALEMAGYGLALNEGETPTEFSNRLYSDLLFVSLHD